ncbi:NMN_adenylyl transferase and transcriptional regulator [Hexamita inflata]|uniref:NMN adenylyl transferase and transcriptional regulator n=1 Tax=Hexamita inflata TaxID=28002 RepID=A0AA86U049_9EUKA|nr:NMN adenylyl transferase and transcriptional regulator [Hexamita inflata]
MQVGLFIGKFNPPHLGHISSILQAHAMCDMLYVCVCANSAEEQDKSVIPGKTRKMWLSQEFQPYAQIKVIRIDEANIPAYPNGWVQFASLVKTQIQHTITICFGGEEKYRDGFKTHFNASYTLIDPLRKRNTISSTLIKQNPTLHFNFICKSARPHFTKKVLVCGTESCGKTVLTMKLAQIFNTNWSEEVGRYYSERYLGFDEEAYSDSDFVRICSLQIENDILKINGANKICFFDTDAVITQYYAEMYQGHCVPAIETFVNPDKFDLVLIMTPQVKWVDDGLRFLGEQEKREQLHQKLKQMYIDRGFKNIVEVSGTDYHERLQKCVELCDELLQ